MVENGMLKIGFWAGMKVGEKFRLEDWAETFKCAATEGGLGESVYFIPNGE